MEGFERVRECPKSHGSVREAFVFSERGLEKAAGVSLQCSSQQESGAHFLCLRNTDVCPVHQCAEDELFSVSYCNDCYYYIKSYSDLHVDFIHPTSSDTDLEMKR